MICPQLKQEAPGIHLEPFEMRHCLWIINHNKDGAYSRKVIESQIRASGVFAQKGVGFTAMVGNYPLASAGAVELWEGVGLCWAYISNDLSNRKIWFVRTAKRILEDVSAFKNFRRMEAHVIEGFTSSMRWLEHMQFVNETPNGMRNYGEHGETFYLFARSFDVRD